MGKVTGTQRGSGLVTGDGEGVPLYYSGLMSETATDATRLDSGAVLSGSARTRHSGQKGAGRRNSRSELAGIWWEQQRRRGRRAEMAVDRVGWQKWQWSVGAGASSGDVAAECTMQAVSGAVRSGSARGRGRCRAAAARCSSCTAPGAAGPWR